MGELEQYIHSTFGIAPDEMNTIASLFKPESLSKDAFYLKTSQYGDKLSFIRSGMLRIFVNRDDKEITQWISTPSYFICDLNSLMFGTPARWNIQALSDTELYTISGRDYRSIGQLVPRWHELEKAFIARCFSTIEDRILSHLSMSAEERYLAFQARNPSMFEQVPLHYIASMLGMTPETFSRIRKKYRGIKA